MSKKLLVFITLFSLGLVALSLYIISTMDPGKKPKPIAEISNISSLNLKVDAQFKLSDDYDQAFTQDNLKNKFTLIYFGFAHCPDLCPATLAKFKETIALLNPIEKQRIQFVFVSIDPVRDDTYNLHQFISQFGPDIKAITGEQEELHKLTSSLKVYYAQDKHHKKEEDYYVDHSSFVYLLNPKAELTSQFASTILPEEIAKHLQAILK